MTAGIPEYPFDLPVPLLDHDRNLTARPSQREMESGRIRRRRMQAELQEFLKVNWNFTEDEFAAFKSFYEDILDNGTIQFLLKTSEEDPAGSGETVEVWWEVAFVAKPQHVRGDNLFSVSATLEVLDVLFLDPLPAITFGYFRDEGHEDINEDVENFPSDCRQNVSVVMDDLEEGALYLLEISPDSTDGSWDRFIFFALLTTEERETKHKRVSMSNWFLRNGVNEGQPWFRVKLYRDAAQALVDEVITQPNQPLPPEVDAPDLTVANVSEIDTSEQISGAATDTYAQGVQPLAAYRTSNGYVIPYSYLEDPMVFSSRMYRPFIRKYIIRQHSWGHWGTLSTEGSQDTPVTITGPVGATLKWTRDGTLPTLATPTPTAYGGVPDNAYVIENQFDGILLARCFSGDCPSPLVMVCIDKLMYERPNFSTTGPATGVSGYCDLPQVDIVTGLLIESGNSCNIVYGGICPHEALIISLGWAGGGIALSRDNPFTNHGAALLKKLKRVDERIYIGWPIHSTAAEHYTFLSSVWNNPGAPYGSGYFNHWQVAARNHNWAVICRNTDPLDQEGLGTSLFLGLIMVPFGASLAGPAGGDADSDRAAWDGARDEALGQIMEGFELPEEACTNPYTFWMFADRFDIFRSPLNYDEPRDLQWLGGIDLDEEIVDIPSDPDPESEPANPYDKFETYYDGDVVGVTTLSFKTGTHWDAAWTIKNGTNNTYGWDLFDGYADGATGEWSEFQPPEYVPFDQGENWYFNPDLATDDEWVFRTGELAQVYSDDFSSYADGPAPFAMTGGTGWTTDDIDGWKMANDLVGGSETWDGYADGAFVPDNTGSNFLLSENWITS